MPDQFFPLAFGQLGAYRSALRRPDMTPTSSLANLSMTAETVCQRPDQAQELLQTLERRHEALRIAIDVNANPEPQQSILPTRRISHPVIEAPESSWATHYAPTANLSLADGYLWRATILHDPTTLKTSIGIIISHMIADAWGLDILRRDLLHYPGDLSPSAPSLQAFVHSERSRWHEGAPAAKRTIQHWASSVAGWDDNVPDFGDETRVHRVQGPWSEESSASLIRLGVGLTTVVLDAYLHAIPQTGQDHLVCLVASNRIRKVDRGLLTSMIQPTPLLLKRPNSDADNSLLALNSAIISALRVSRFHPDVVQQSVPRKISSTGDGFPTVVNVHNAPSFMSGSPTSTTQDERWSIPSPKGFVHYLQAAQDNAQLSVQWHCADNEGTQPQAGEIRDRIMQTVSSASPPS